MQQCFYLILINLTVQYTAAIEIMAHSFPTAFFRYVQSVFFYLYEIAQSLEYKKIMFLFCLAPLQRIAFFWIEAEDVTKYMRFCLYAVYARKEVHLITYFQLILIVSEHLIYSFQDVVWYFWDGFFFIVKSFF